MIAFNRSYIPFYTAGMLCHGECSCRRFTVGHKRTSPRLGRKASLPFCELAVELVFVP